MSLDKVFPEFVIVQSRFACPKCQKQMYLKIGADAGYIGCIDCKIEFDANDEERKLSLKHNGIEE